MFDKLFNDIERKHDEFKGIEREEVHFFDNPLIYPTLYEEKLKNIGSFSEDTVVVDGHVITARGAGAAGYFALALVEQLFGAEKASEVKSAVVMDIVEKNLGL